MVKCAYQRKKEIYKMKTTLQQLSKNFSAKAGLDVQVNNFDEFKALLVDLVPVIKLDENNEDIDTSSLNAMTDGYFSECYTPEIRITAQKEVIAKLRTIVQSDRCSFDTEDDTYDDFSSVPDGVITWCVMGYDKLGDVLEQVRAFSEREQINLAVALGNVTPKNDDKDIINYRFENGRRIGGGIIRVEESNSAWYVMYLYWLCYAFCGMTMEEVDAIGIEIEVQ